MNEEYSIINEGKKIKEKADVRHYSFLEVSYMSTHQSIVTRFFPIDDYFGANFYTENLDGTIVYSGYSGNNNELFHNLYLETISYNQEHPGINIMVEKKHFFEINYTDIYGEQHTIVKTENHEIDPKRLAEIRTKAGVDAKGKTFSIKNPNLNEILNICFPEQFNN